MQLLKATLLLLVGLLTVKLARAGLFSSSHKYYDEIDSYLTKTVDSDDVEKNMAVAAEWLAKLERKGGSLVKALKQFLELKSVLNEDMCNRQAYEILATNDKKANYPVRDGSKKVSVRRIEKIVQYYAREHSERCTDVWPKLLADKMNELTPESRKYVLYLAEQKTIPWNHDFRNENFIRMIRAQLAADPEHQKKVAKKRYYYERNEVTMGDFRKYMVHPCEELKKVAIDELFEPIKFDISLQGREIEFSKGNDEYKDFRLARSAMNYCDYILTFKGLIWNQIWVVQQEDKVIEMDAEKEAAKH